MVRTSRRSSSGSNGCKGSALGRRLAWVMTAPLLTVSAAERLLAYAWLRLEASGEASGEAFVLEPGHPPRGPVGRGGPWLDAAAGPMPRCLGRAAVSSHVYRLNEASMPFTASWASRRCRENAQAVAFTLRRRPVVGGWMWVGLSVLWPGAPPAGTQRRWGRLSGRGTGLPGCSQRHLQAGRLATGLSSPGGFRARS